MSRKYFIAPIGRLSRKAVKRALGRLVRSGALGEVRSITSDNGCEFLDPGAIERITRCKVYYARAYASYGKDSVESANRLVRRWHPKGTDFSRYSRAEIASLQETIKSIHRLILGGPSANESAASIKTA